MVPKSRYGTVLPLVTMRARSRLVSQTKTRSSVATKLEDQSLYCIGRGRYGLPQADVQPTSKSQSQRGSCWVVCCTFHFHQNSSLANSAIMYLSIICDRYATSPELNTFSALIQNFYASNGDGTHPYPAVHLTVSSNPGKDITCRTYISSSVGTTADRAADSCLFVPVPYEIKYAETERNALESLSLGKTSSDRQVSNIVDIHSLEAGIIELLEMVSRVSNYVSQILAGETLPSVAIGQALLNTLNLAPKVDASELEKLFNTHLQDVLLVSYLANTIRTQIDLSNKLASTVGTIATPPKTDHKRQQKERD
ncbi:hypothetical protein TWF173_010022 [Orbilia oligospora]|uniref:EIF3F/CSN6-like C-terminal domain-containing protein n=1 Tax=Orbilia oligospora TaxID=2813651 RepID=A0A7C8R4A5_ORBOL|nr:hypothetical protein TWF970_010710 [Orbilia oligospora]KAF3310223.1 hypothetical protein TWF173_010022 [Orbilia oligospora]